MTQEVIESWEGNQFVIERFDDWLAMKKILDERYGSTHTRRDTYVHSLSPHVNTIEGYPNRRIGTRLVSSKPVIEETRLRVDRTLVSIDTSHPNGEHTDYKMEDGPDGKPRVVVEGGKPVVLEKYYTLKEKRVHYILTLSDSTEKDSAGNEYQRSFLNYGPWKSWGPIGSIRTVRLNVSLERIEGKPGRV
jgi:hypothetical protein